LLSNQLATFCAECGTGGHTVLGVVTSGIHRRLLFIYYYHTLVAMEPYECPYFHGNNTLKYPWKPMIRNCLPLHALS